VPAPRKIFRIEMTNPAAAVAAWSGHEAPSSANQQEILTELKSLHELLARRNAPATASPTDRAAVGGLRQLKDETDAIQCAISRTRDELATLDLSGFDAGGGRVLRELGAVVNSAEQATQQLLDSAEQIDEAASALSVVLKQEQHQALTQDIQDQVIRIFEACNFHDLTGQRITKVLATLKLVEDHVVRMREIWRDIDAFKGGVTPAPQSRRAGNLLNGPKLKGDQGHASQAEIDVLFRTG
jgi:chemotaxis protein CheZ